MGFDDAGNQCFVKRQPETPEEVNQMLRAVWSSCIACLRYEGKDPEVVRRLVDLGMGEQCDAPSGTLPERQVRHHGAISVREADDPGSAALLTDLRTVLLRSPKAKELSTEIRKDSDGHSFFYKWWEFETAEVLIRLIRVEPWSGAYLVSVGGSNRTAYTGAAISVDGALRADERIHSIRWHTRPDWEEACRLGQELPY